MRPSMSSGSAARIRSTDSITEVSAVIVAMSRLLHHALARVEKWAELVLFLRLRVHAYERLGPRQSHQEPRAIVEEELRPVVGVEVDDPRHRVAAELLGRGLAEPRHDPLLRRGVGRRVHAEITPQIMRGSHQAHELGDQLGWLLARLEHEVEEEETGDDPVTLRKMHREAKPPRLLAAHHRAGLLHLRTDVLEAHRHLVDLDAVLLAEAVDHRAHVHRLHDRLAQAADLPEAPHE